MLVPGVHHSDLIFHFKMTTMINLVVIYHTKVLHIIDCISHTVHFIPVTFIL